MSVPAKIFSGFLRAGVSAALLSLCPLAAENEGAVSESAARLAEKVEAWEAELDAIYAPDPFDPEIPFLPEKTPDPEIAAKKRRIRKSRRSATRSRRSSAPSANSKKRCVRRK